MIITQAGNTYDITKYIDASSHTVSRSNVYRNVSFKFPEAKTFAVYNSNLLLVMNLVMKILKIEI